MTKNAATSGRILQEVLFIVMLPCARGPKLPNGLELSCPAAQATSDPLSPQPDGPGSRTFSPRQPGQLQRGVRQPGFLPEVPDRSALGIAVTTDLQPSPGSRS